MPEVRTHGKLFGHVANAQFNECSAASGVPNPNMGVDNEQKTTKAEIVKALADSFDDKDQRQAGCWQSQRSSILFPACLQ